VAFFVFSRTATTNPIDDVLVSVLESTITYNGILTSKPFAGVCSSCHYTRGQKTTTSHGSDESIGHRLLMVAGTEKFAILVW
jgi:hypothetical protein